MDKGAFSIAYSFVEEFNDRVEQISRLTNHPGSKGRFIELLLINLLRKYLPKKYDFFFWFLWVICKSPWIKVDMVALFLLQDVAQL